VQAAARQLPGEQGSDGHEQHRWHERPSIGVGAGLRPVLNAIGGWAARLSGEPGRVVRGPPGRATEDGPLGSPLYPRQVSAGTRQRLRSKLTDGGASQMRRSKRLYINLITSGWLVALVLAAQAGPVRITRVIRF
jgi:hypothetical protein